MILHPADIILVHGAGWLSRAIRALTRDPGERATWVSHVGIAVDSTNIVEALNRGVVMRRLAYPPSRVRIYRSLNVPPTTLRRIAGAAEFYVGQKYGWGKLILHALDGLLGGARVFRRLSFLENFPICSFVVAAAYEAAGYHFGVPQRYATPDDIADFLQAHTDKYRRIQ